MEKIKLERFESSIFKKKRGKKTDQIENSNVNISVLKIYTFVDITVF